MSETIQFETTSMRQDPAVEAVFSGDPDKVLPNVAVVPYEGAEVRNRAMARGYAIHDSEGNPVGTFNLVGNPKGERRWINDVRINPERRGERIAVAAYAGVMAILASEGVSLMSDPQGISDSALRVWESLSRRGAVTQLGDKDVHGNPRFISRNPYE